MEIQNDCCVCLDILEDFNTITFTCKHTIHGNCFAEIIKISANPRCPSCRRWLIEFNDLNRIVIDLEEEEEFEEDGIIIDIPDTEPELFIKVELYKSIEIKAIILGFFIYSLIIILIK